MTDSAQDARGNLLQAPAERRPTRGLLPDPEPQEMRYTVISVDDHLVEPPDMFEGRLANQFPKNAPRVVDQDDGLQAWVFDVVVYEQVGLDAQLGVTMAGTGASPMPEMSCLKMRTFVQSAGYLRLTYDLMLRGGAPDGADRVKAVS
ncbi:hypothetical protein [Ilumatobacter sp.]|uniref:hypothetical protein n=1 Tax=Ilumatobacter sp. TaxID=1967498 RepID=UPI0037525782